MGDSEKKRVWFDAEFLEDGKTIQLISIGMVRESDGATYYAETQNAHLLAGSTPWLAAHVLPHLSGPVRSRGGIANDIVTFAGTAPEFWAWYGSYDWVVLCQLYGRMIDLPKGWPMYVRDLKQEADRDGTALPAFRDDSRPAHDALSDALELRDRHLWLDARRAASAAR